MIYIKSTNQVPEFNVNSAEVAKVAIKNSIESKALSRHQEEKLVKYGTRKMTREDWRSATNICYLLLTEPPRKHVKKQKTGNEISCKY